MRWPWRKLRPVNPPLPPGEGREAANRAKGHLDRVDSRWVEVNSVASSLRSLRTENHFAEQISTIFSGKGRK